MGRLGLFAAFQAGWLACVAGAGAGHPWIGPAAVSLLVGLHLARVRDRGGTLRYVLAAGLCGGALETAFQAAGLLSYRENVWATPWAPPWIVALWVLFAASIRPVFGWLGGRPLLAAALGAAGGPLSYLAGSRLGAVAFGPRPLLTALVLALAWALALPVLVRLAPRES